MTREEEIAYYASLAKQENIPTVSSREEEINKYANLASQKGAVQKSSVPSSFSTQQKGSPQFSEESLKLAGDSMYSPVTDYTTDVNKPAEYNPNSGNFLDAVIAGTDNSVISGIGDIVQGKKGGSGYQSHHWSTELSAENAKGILNDLGNMTGQMITDLPVILGFSALLTPTVGFGAYSATKSAVEQKRDLGQVSAKEVAKEGAIGYLSMLALGGGKQIAGKATEGLLTKYGGDTLKTYAENIGGAVGNAAGITAMSATDIVGHSDIKDLGKNMQELPQSIIKNAALAFTMEKGHSGFKKLKESMQKLPDRETFKAVMDDTTSDEMRTGIAKGYTENYISKIKSNMGQAWDKAFEGDKQLEAYTVAEDMLINMEKSASYYRNIRDQQNTVKAKNSATGTTVRLFDNPEYKHKFYSEMVKHVEDSYGVKTGLLDENGSFKDSYYFEPTEVIQEKMNKLSNDFADRVKDPALPLPTDPERFSVLQQHMKLMQMEKINAARENVYGKDFLTSKKLVNSKYTLAGETAKERMKPVREYIDSYNRETKTRDFLGKDDRIDNSTVELLSKMAGLPESEYKMRASAPDVRSAPISVLESWRANLRTAQQMMQRLGTKTYRFLYEPFREADAINQRKVRDIVDNTNKLQRKLTRDERIQVTMELARKQVKRNGDKIVNIGEGIINDLIADGRIKKDKHLRRYEDFTPEQKEFHDYMRMNYDIKLKQINELRAIRGQEELIGLEDYMSLMVQKNSLPNTRDLEPWLIKTKLESSNVHKNAFSIKRTLGMSDISIEAGDAFNNYMAYAERVLNLSPVAEHWVKFADALEAHNLAMADYVRDTAKYFAGEVADMTPAKRMLLDFNNKITGSFLSWSAGTLVTQVTSLRATVSEFGLSDTLEGIMRVIKEKKYDKAEFDNLESAVIRSACMDVTVQDLEHGVGMRNRYIEMGMKGMKSVDLLMRKVTYDIAFEKYKSQGMDTKSANFWAGEMVNKTQASASRADISKFHRTALGKFLAPFQTFTFGNIGYIAHDIFGIDPAYKVVKSFDTRESADAYMKDSKTKMELQRIETGEGYKYAVYEKEAIVKAVDGIRKAFYFACFTALTNTAYKAMQKGLEDVNPTLGKVVGSVVKSPLASPINAFTEAKNGISFDDRLLNTSSAKDYAKSGTHKGEYEYKIINGRYVKVPKSAYRKNLEAGFAATASIFGEMPIVGNLLKSGSGAEGAGLGLINRVGADAIRYSKSGRGIDALAVANDVSAVFGTPTYQPFRYIIKARREMENAAKENAQLRNKYRGNGLKSSYGGQKKINSYYR